MLYLLRQTYYGCRSTDNRSTTVVRKRKGGKCMAISSDVIRGYNDTMILYLLLDKPSYGYEISKQIKTLSNEKYVIKETTPACSETVISSLFRIRTMQPASDAPITASPKPEEHIISKNAKNGCSHRKL